MKFLSRLILIFSLLFGGICVSNNFVQDISQSYAANKISYQKTALTGGGATALDGIDGATLNDGDFAIVMYSSQTYFYLLVAASGATESSPGIIAPDTNPGTKRWILQSIPIYHYPNNNDSGAAYGFMTSSKLLSASGNTTVFLITFDNSYGNGYFTFTYAGAVSTTLYNGIKAERNIRLVDNVATITTIGTDDLRGNTPPATIWTDNSNGTITITVTNNNGGTSTGHAVIEGRGGGSSSNTGLRGFTFSLL